MLLFCLIFSLPVTYYIDSKVFSLILANFPSTEIYAQLQLTINICPFQKIYFRSKRPKGGHAKKRSQQETIDSVETKE